MDNKIHRLSLLGSLHIKIAKSTEIIDLMQRRSEIFYETATREIGGCPGKILAEDYPKHLSINKFC